MPYADLAGPALYGLSAFLAAFAALTVSMRIARRSGAGRPAAAGDLFGDTLVFLVRGGRLVDCNFPARRFIDADDGGRADLCRLRRRLHALFDDPDELLDPDRSGDTMATSCDGTVEAIAERAGSTLRLKVRSRLRDTPSPEDIHLIAAQRRELQTLREATDLSPCPAWRQTPEGTPVWINRAYLDLGRRVFGTQRMERWPPPRLFPDLSRGGTRRVSIDVAGDDGPRWYDCHGVPVGRDLMFVAVDAAAAVDAESRLENFMQTLTKTFAQLTIGLAIFDRSRNLALFNPALTELTLLPVDFLASHPSLVEFLDRLRDKAMMPEPKDYPTWRRSIAELEAAASDGTFQETWSLPGNLTYRVTGRPHPDGAIAFLFEDISAEMSLTRHFRREIETAQAVLDNMEDATALFSRAGVLVQSNRAYRALWGVDPEEGLSETSVIDASRTWHDQTVPSPIWGDFRDFALDPADRSEWSATATLLDGRNIECRFIPMPGGETQVVFHIAGSGSGSRGLLEVV